MSFIITTFQSAVFLFVIVSVFCLLQCLVGVLAIVVCCLVCMWIENYKHELIVVVMLSASQAKVCWLFVVYKGQHSLWRFQKRNTDT